MRGLYVHIPFCVRKCSYCDFYSLPVGEPSPVKGEGKGDHCSNSPSPVSLREGEAPKQSAPVSPADNHGLLRFARNDKKGRFRVSEARPLIATYIAAVIQEARKYSGLSFQTLYLGGGTPSLLGAGGLRDLIDTLRSSLDLSGLAEATVEANPESATREFLEAAREARVNRVSFGIQSLSDNELGSVGRIHSAAQAIEAIERAKEAGFKAISADLIVGLPGQTWASLRTSIETLCGGSHYQKPARPELVEGSTRAGDDRRSSSEQESLVDHLSLYCLSVEEGTPLAACPPDDLMSDDMQAELFDKAADLLGGLGFGHYEISNFALRGHECLHNLNYWRGGEYLGLGPAAASHLNGKRFRNRADLDAYLAEPTGQVEYIEELPPQDKAAEEAMLRLRLPEEGLQPGELAARFGHDSVETLVARLDGMVREGLLLCQESRYHLPTSRILTSNPIFARVLSA